MRVSNKSTITILTFLQVFTMTQPIQTPKNCSNDEANIIFQCMKEIRSQSRNGKTSTESFRKMQEEISKYIENGEVYMNLHAYKPDHKLKQQESKKLFDELKRSRDAVNEITKTISQGQKSLRQEYSAVVRKYYESVIQLEKNVQTIGNTILETVEKQKKTERNDSAEARRETMAEYLTDIRSAVQFLKNEFNPLDTRTYKGKTLMDRAEECIKNFEENIVGKLKHLNDNNPFLVKNVDFQQAMSPLNCCVNNIRVCIEYLIANFEYSEHQDLQRARMTTACSGATNAIDECLKSELLHIDEKIAGIKKTMEATKNLMQKLDETKKAEMIESLNNFCKNHIVKVWVYDFLRINIHKTFTTSDEKQALIPASQIPSHLEPVSVVFWKFLLTYLRLLHEKVSLDLEQDLFDAEKIRTSILLKQVVFKARKAIFSIQEAKIAQSMVKDRNIHKLSQQIVNTFSVVYTIQNINPQFFKQCNFLYETKESMIVVGNEFKKIIDQLNIYECEDKLHALSAEAEVTLDDTSKPRCNPNIPSIAVFLKEFDEEHTRINSELKKRFDERSKRYARSWMLTRVGDSYNTKLNFPNTSEADQCSNLHNQSSNAFTIAKSMDKSIKVISDAPDRDEDEQYASIIRKIAAFFSKLSKLYARRSEQTKLEYQISLSKKELDIFDENLQHIVQIHELANMNINCLEKSSDLAISITNSALLVSQVKTLLDEINCLFDISQNEHSANQNEHKNVLEKIKTVIRSLLNTGVESQHCEIQKIEDLADILNQFNDEHVVADGTQSLIIDTERLDDITIPLDYFLDFYPLQGNENDKNVKNLIQIQERKLIAWIKREGYNLICYEKSLVKKTDHTVRVFKPQERTDELEKEENAIETEQKIQNVLENPSKAKNNNNSDSSASLDMNHCTTHSSSNINIVKQKANNGHGTKSKNQSGKENAKTLWQRILLITTFVALAVGLIATFVYFRWYCNPK